MLKCGCRCGKYSRGINERDGDRNILKIQRVWGDLKVSVRRASLRGSAENLTPLFFYSSLALRNTVFPVSDYFSFIFDNAFQMKETIHLLIVFALLGPS